MINQNHIDDLEDNKAKLNLPDFVYKCYGNGFTKRKIVGYRKRSTRYDLVFEDLENGKLYLEESDYIKAMIKKGFYTKQEM